MSTNKGMAIEWIGLNDLIVDSSYQRGQNRAHIDKIVSNFNPNLVNPVRVFKIGNEYHVIDGQHTREVLRTMGWEEAPCLVLNGTTGVEEAADYFVKVNTGRKALRPLEVFNAALTAKNPQAVAIDRIVTSFDLRVAAGTTSGIAAVKRLERIYKDGGKSALESVLRVITQTWDPDEQHRFHGNMLLGMHLYLMREPSVNLERIVTRLKRTSPVDILRKARASAIGSDIAYATEREIREAVKRRNL